MLIGKSSAALIVGILLTACSFSGENYYQEPEESWWLSKEFKATEDNLLGVPVSKINPEWKLVSVLDDVSLKQQLAPEQYRDIKNSALVLNLTTRLGKAPVEGMFIVGVYLSNSGQVGRFLAIMENSEIVQYFTHEGLAAYSAIYAGDGETQWYKCMECNDYDTIYWNGFDYVLR